jgi:FkbM family methyltransferase
VLPADGADPHEAKMSTLAPTITKRTSNFTPKLYRNEQSQRHVRVNYNFEGKRTGRTYEIARNIHIMDKYQSMKPLIKRQERIKKKQWQRICASGDPYTLVSARETFIVHTNDPVGENIFLHGEYDFDKLTLALQLLGRSSINVLVDVGANIGSICIPAITRKIAQKAVAIEPEAVNFSLLTANVSINNVVADITCHQIALGPEDNQLVRLELSTDNFGDHRVTPTNGAHRERPSTHVSSMRLDSIVPHLNPHTDLIFMDVQGFEKFVLDGSTEAINARVPIVMEYFPEGIQEHCSLDNLLDVISPYSGYFDLNMPVPVFTPLEGLREFWDGLLAGPYEFGDIVLL